MFEIKCESCGGWLVPDQGATLEDYSKNIRTYFNKEGSVVEESIPNYLVYSCDTCKKTYKLTYKEWEKRYRKEIILEVMELRKMRMFSTEINPYTIDPDNGLEFCGQCSGYAGDGYCLVDIIRQCTIRKDNDS